MKRSQIKPIVENYPHRINIDEDDYQFLRYALSRDVDTQYTFNVREGDVINYVLALARRRLSEIEYLNMINSISEDDQSYPG